MSLIDALRDALKSRTTRKTDETVEASRAVRRILTTFSEEGKIDSVEDIRTVDRVLAPALDWQEILRPPTNSRRKQIRNGA